ncbi:MAG TPA: gamma carbonic anhydrase family protein [Xanthobacteraceae bacterium]|jgi:carbonic anhydrase/acetyltransferase-like protein (isoleucine patch superfamily)|nr:gamma carbonic anhydrase family protein [Xanthobacteraceae bacterium]
MPIYELDGQAPELPEHGRYWIADTAVIIGRIRLKTDASIWFGSVLRGDNEWIEIGERSNVQESCTLHTDMGFPLVVGPDATIGHNVVLHGCTIGANSLIGMGAVLLNGVKIGRSSVVGAGSLVTEGKEFPDNSLIVGSPARAIRTLDENAVAQFGRAARHYVQNWQRYAKGLKRIG